MVKFGRLKIWLLANLWLIFLLVSIISAVVLADPQDPWPTG
jgi:hypothetical protein